MRGHLAMLSLGALTIGTPIWHLAPPVHRMECVRRDQVRWSPAKPVRGAFFEVLVSDADTATRLTAIVAGERLHFSGREPRTLVALAPLPIDSTRGISVQLICAQGDTVSVRVSAAPARYAVEKLTVAPQFGEEPDSALAARMRRESERAASVAAASHDTPRLWSLDFIAPRRSRITSSYGRAREFNGAITSRHMGTDYAGSEGAIVRASNRGVVRLVDSFYLGGNVVYIDHGEGVTSAYLHLSRTLVSIGDTVERGATIGNVGATGRVTGPHLHFISRYGRFALDPGSLIGLTLGPEKKARRVPSKSRH